MNAQAPQMPDGTIRRKSIRMRTKCRLTTRRTASAGSIVSLFSVARKTVFTLLVAGCATVGARPASSISLSKSTCLGKCPAYTMRLYSDGSYEWTGVAHVTRSGTRRGRFDVEVYRQAKRLISNADIGQFRDKYESGPDCTTWTTDQQTVVIGIEDGAREIKMIVHYLGCEGFAREDELRRFESELEKGLKATDFIR